ncbi:MAG: hypothetical protein J5I93_07595 [Pirellulaceae bacterium]|nr:hypothetical protein [Pirellulaceae bacterium]
MMTRLVVAACLTVWLLLPASSTVAEEPLAASDAKDATAATEARRPADERQLRQWLENMVWQHRFSRSEVAAATGLSEAEIDRALRQFDIRPDNRPPRDERRLLVLPYPGGRHPRIGFLEGAVRPQRETKLSVFTPWHPDWYVVLDVPEAIWWQTGTSRELLYLAHTHIDTTWTRRGIELPALEWLPGDDGSWRMERRLPNGVVFGTEARSSADGVRLRMWLTNGTRETLTGLRVQNCVLLKGAPPFAGQTSDNKVLSKPFAACRDEAGQRWVITAWEPCDRVWANPPCPCMHSDPQFSDCPPDKTVELRGWLSFYTGGDVDAELRRLKADGGVFR